jgi:NAD(P)-dependent dehydrogenase (short-subunit alcohol dehydrogenase family)
VKSPAGADVAGIDIAAAVSPILDYKSATVEDLTETGRLVTASGARWMQHLADQRNIAEIRAAAGHIEQTWGGADIVFANAGIQAFKPLLDMSDADWHDQIEVNLTGTGNVLRVFAPLLVRRGGGRIIVTSSTQGQHGTKFGASYSASKWGIIGLLTAKAPLGVPWIEPEDVAPLIVFLASDGARMVSGTSFAATGGDGAHLTA